MVKISRTLDSQVFAKESSQGTEGSTFTVNAFGDVPRCTLSFTDEVEEVKDADNSAEISKLVDKTHLPTGSMSFLPGDFTHLQYIFGDYLESGGTTYTGSTDDKSLPTSLTIRGNYDNSKVTQVTGCYFNNWSMTVAKGEIVTCSQDIVGIKPSTETATVYYSPPSADPLIFNGGVVTYDGDEWDLDTITLSINPKFSQEFSIKTISAGDKRFPNEIIRSGKYDIKLNGVCNTQLAANEIEEAWEGTSPADLRSDVNIVLTFTQASKTHVITVSGRTTSTEVMQDTGTEGAKTMSFNATGKSVDLTGDL